MFSGGTGIKHWLKMGQDPKKELKKLGQASRF